MKNILIALMRYYGISLTLENFNQLRYSGIVPELMGPEDEADLPDEVLICDFCSGTPIVARYHAQDFVIIDPSFLHGSIGDWGACAFCEKLIDVANWDALLAHAVISFYEHHPECDGVLPVEFVREHLRALYDKLQESGFKKTKMEKSI